MPKRPYRSAPLATDRSPAGIPYIVSNEAAERFSFYGMKAILVVFMTRYLVRATGANDFMTDSQATEWQAWFVASAYFFPILGALVSDIFIGKYRTILLLSSVYCVGHISLAMMDLPESWLGRTCEPRTFLLAGLSSSRSEAEASSRACRLMSVTSSDNPTNTCSRKSLAGSTCLSTSEPLRQRLLLRCCS